MRMHFIFILVSLLPVGLFAQSGKDYTITIAVNFEDCINCNRALYDLEEFRDQYHLQIVIPEIYISDSSKVFEEYEFNTMSDTVLWSDSLFMKYSSFGASSISIESKYGTGLYTELVANIYVRNLMGFLKWQSQGRRELYADYPFITKGVNHYLYTDNGLLLTNMVFDKKIEVYDHVKQELLYSIEIDKATRKIAFGQNDYGFLEEDFEAHNEYMKKSGVKSFYEISDMLYVEDTVFVFLQTSMLKYMTHKTLGYAEYLVYSNSLLKYLDGQLHSIHKIEDMQKEGEDLTYTFSNNTASHYHDGNIYVNIGLSSASYPGVIIIDRPYIAKLIMDSAGVYKMDVFKERSIHKAYSKTINYSDMQFRRNVYKFVFLKEVFDLETGEAEDTLFFFPEIKEADNNTRPRRSPLNHGLEISKNFIWSLAIDYRKEKIYFYKMSRKNKLYKTNSLEFPKQLSRMHFRFDPLNPDYIIYNENNKIVRRKIF